MKNIVKLCLLLIAVGWVNIGFGQQCVNIPTCGTSPQTAMECNYNNWNWENYDCKNWNANTVAGSTYKTSLGSPWCNQGQSDIVAIGTSQDYTKSRGWVLLRRDFGCLNTTNYPYFVLYNRFTGIIRVFFWLSDNQLYSRFVVTLSNNNGNSALASFANQYPSNYDKYLTNSTLGNNDIYTVTTAQSSKNQWSVAEFNVPFDPNIANSVNSSEIRFDIYGIVDFAMKADITGASNSQTVTDYNLKSFAFVTKQITPDGPAALKFIGQAKSLLSSIKDIDPDKSKKDLLKSITDINNSEYAPQFVKDLAVKSENLVTSIFDIASDVIPMAKAFSKTLNFADKFIGYIVPKKPSVSVTIPEQNGFITGTSTATTKTEYNLVLNGEIKTSISQTQIVIKVPGNPNQITTGGNLSYYNCPLGVFALKNTCSVLKKSYSRFVGKVIDKDGPHTTEIYESYKVNNDLIPVINKSSGMEIVSFEAALSANILPKDNVSNPLLSDTAVFNLFKESTPEYTNYMLNDLYYGRTELAKYDNYITKKGTFSYPRGYHTIRTPFVDYKAFNGSILNVQAGTRVYLTVKVLLKTAGSNINTTSPLLVTHNYEIDVNNNPILVDNPNYEISNFSNLPPYNNYKQNPITSEKIYSGTDVSINKFFRYVYHTVSDGIVSVNEGYQDKARLIVFSLINPIGIIADAKRNLTLIGVNTYMPPIFYDSDPQWRIYYNTVPSSDYRYRMQTFNKDNNFKLYNYIASNKKEIVYRAGSSIEILPFVSESDPSESESSEIDLSMLGCDEIIFTLDYGTQTTVVNPTLNSIEFISTVCSNEPYISYNVNAQRFGDEQFEKLDNYAINVSPNPFNNNFSLNVEKYKGQQAIITIIDQIGRTIKTISQNLVEDNLDIDLTDAPSGLFLVKINGETSNDVLKVIKE